MILIKISRRLELETKEKFGIVFLLGMKFVGPIINKHVDIFL